MEESRVLPTSGLVLVLTPASLKKTFGFPTKKMVQTKNGKSSSTDDSVGHRKQFNRPEERERALAVS